MKSQLSNACFGMFISFLVMNLQNVLYLCPLGAKVSNMVALCLRLSGKGSYFSEKSYGPPLQFLHFFEKIIWSPLTIFVIFWENHMVHPYNFGDSLRNIIWSPLMFFQKIITNYWKFLEKTIGYPIWTWLHVSKNHSKFRGGYLWGGGYP